MSTTVISPIVVVDTSSTNPQIISQSLGIPHAPTSALTAALILAAGNVDVGTHSYKVTFIDGHGFESAPSPASNIITTDASHKQVSLTGIPLGPTATGSDGLNATVSRKVYRTIAGNIGSAKLVTTIADNTTTIFTDNVADSSLGVPAPGVSVSSTVQVV